MNGRTIASYDVKDKTTIIPTAALPSGMYLLHITNGTQKVTQRFIKQ